MGKGMRVKVAIEASGIGVKAVGVGAKRKRASRPSRKDQGRVSERWQRAARKELEAYFARRLRSFATPCDLRGLTPFTRAVLRITAKIPYGELRSYRWVARRLGRPRATRAVGNALARNPIPIMIPCHRVVRSDGSLGGYALGLGWKRRLLDLESF